MYGGMKPLMFSSFLAGNVLTTDTINTHTGFDEKAPYILDPFIDEVVLEPFDFVKCRQNHHVVGI